MSELQTQLETLLLSQEHWLENWQDVHHRKVYPDTRATSCACCEQWATHVDCFGCPIFADTLQPGCLRTPYHLVEELVYDFASLQGAKWAPGESYPDDPIFHEQLEFAVAAEYTYLADLALLITKRIQKDDH